MHDSQSSQKTKYQKSLVDQMSLLQSSISVELYANYWGNISKPFETRLLQTRMGRDGLEPQRSLRLVIYPFNCCRQFARERNFNQTLNIQEFGI